MKKTILIGMCLFALVMSSLAANPYKVASFESNGRQVDRVIVPGRPPKVKAQVASVPESHVAAGINVLPTVPAFSWSYGCSATAAAMMMGYYDNIGYANMYTGPANGGVCPMNNETYWGTTTYPLVTCGECPLSATHKGIDGRQSFGHVDDYWVDSEVAGIDPYVTAQRPEHVQGDCTGDFMGTNQMKYDNIDGSTTFYFGSDGLPLEDYTVPNPSVRDGCHGMRLFAESRGYTVASNFSQYIVGYNGNSTGFSFFDFMFEIDNGRPVLIQIQGHTMLGYGYQSSGQRIYIHDTWDNSDHSMTWGQSYQGMQHFGVTVIRLNPAAPAPVAPARVAASDGEWPGYVFVSWSPSADATTYTVYRATSFPIRKRSWVKHLLITIVTRQQHPERRIRIGLLQRTVGVRAN